MLAISPKKVNAKHSANKKKKVELKKKISGNYERGVRVVEIVTDLTSDLSIFKYLGAPLILKELIVYGVYKTIKCIWYRIIHGTGIIKEFILIL